MILTKLLLHEWALHTTHLKRGSQLFNELIIFENVLKMSKKNTLTAFKFKTLSDIKITIFPN